MLKVVKQALMVAAAVAAFAPVATAADLDAPIPRQYEEATGVAGWYLRVDAGYSWLDWNGGKDGDAPIAGIGAGYQFNPYFRSDVRFDYGFGYNIGGGTEADIATVMGNGYIDIPLGNGLTPYVGAGVGYGWVDYTPGGSDDGLAYAGMAGIAYDINEQLTFDAGYRYRTVSLAGADAHDHSVMAGLRWKF